MTIKFSKGIPHVSEGQKMGIIGVESGIVHDTIAKDALELMDPWQFAETLVTRDRALGQAGVSELLDLAALPSEEADLSGQR